MSIGKQKEKIIYTFTNLNNKKYIIFKVIFTCRLELGDFKTVYDTGHERQARSNFDLTFAPLMFVTVLTCAVIPVLICSVIY